MTKRSGWVSMARCTWQMAAEQVDEWAPVVDDVPKFQAQLTQLK